MDQQDATAVNTVVDNVAAKLGAIADRLETTGGKLVEIMAKERFADGVAYLVSHVFLAVVLTCFAIWLYRKGQAFGFKVEKDGDRYCVTCHQCQSDCDCRVQHVLWTIAGFIFGTLALVNGAMCLNGLPQIIAPEAFAIRQLLGMLR